jgi:hypothetical protein
MKSMKVTRFAVALGIAVSGAVASAQIQLPSQPKKGFGTSVTPAYDGWWTNPDGSFSYLMGYYNRNWQTEVDIPLGPNNHFEPGEPDRGQPTHFYINRNFGMFTVTRPKDTPEMDRLWWVLTYNGQTYRIPMHRQADYNITVTKASEESPGGKYNTAPILRFSQGGQAFQHPYGSLDKALTRTAKVGQPMTLDIWAEDDGLYSSGSNAPLTRPEEVVEVTVGKYRGAGKVTIAKMHEWEITKGGKPAEDFAGKTSTTVTFDQAGDYVLHITGNDLSGKGGGATGCCWTTAMIKVNVTP